jgi:hypothetical protein
MMHVHKILRFVFFRCVKRLPSLRGWFRDILVLFKAFIASQFLHKLSAVGGIVNLYHTVLHSLTFTDRIVV